MKTFFIYIMASETGTLYVGVTSDLRGRIFQHKQKLFPGFTQKYNVTKLVYFEEIYGSDAAFQAEKRIKKWHRRMKDKLIRKMNPSWKDLAANWDNES